MVTAADVASAVDRFLQAEKVAVGVEHPMAWARGFSEYEVELRIPLLVEGQLLGSQLMVAGFPGATMLKFRLMLLFPGAVCRLDFTDEKHVNSLATATDGIPSSVSGPHYHSWPINRRFCRGMNLPMRLHNAVPFAEPGRTFDSILRWFCSDVGIKGLPTTHRIELPIRDRLFP